jgi:hypothetical protein
MKFDSATPSTLSTQISTIQHGISSQALSSSRRLVFFLFIPFHSLNSSFFGQRYATVSTNYCRVQISTSSIEENWRWSFSFIVRMVASAWGTGCGTLLGRACSSYCYGSNTRLGPKTFLLLSVAGQALVLP